MENLKVIISAELSYLSDFDNSLRTLELENDLKLLEVNYIQLEGVYKGSIEQSFLILGITYKEVYQLLNKYNQESALEIGKNRTAGLLYQDGKYQFLGEAVTTYVKPNQDNYSYNPENNLYLITKSI